LYEFFYIKIKNKQTEAEPIGLYIY